MKSALPGGPVLEKIAPQYSKWNNPEISNKHGFKRKYILSEIAQKNQTNFLSLHLLQTRVLESNIPDVSKTIPANLNWIYSEWHTSKTSKKRIPQYVNPKIWVEHPADLKHYTLKIQICNILGEIPKKHQTSTRTTTKTCKNKWGSAQMSRIYPWNHISQNQSCCATCPAKFNKLPP